MATNLDPEELQLIRQTDIPYNFREAIQGGMFGIPGPVMFRLGHYYDPSVGDNWAIKYASQTGNLRVVNELLADRCVDPFAGDNYAIRKAIKY